MDNIDWLSLAVIVLGGLLLWTLLRGAPYVPTKRRDIKAALDAMDLKPGDMVVDLGSGDGAVLDVAAQKGFRAVGYEINPFLVLVSRLRLRKHKNSVQVHFGDFRQAHLPGDTRGIYVFSAGAFLASLQKYLNNEVKLIGHPVMLASYGFELPDQKPAKLAGAAYLYRLQP